MSNGGHLEVVLILQCKWVRSALSLIYQMMWLSVFWRCGHSQQMVVANASPKSNIPTGGLLNCKLSCLTHAPLHIACFSVGGWGLYVFNDWWFTYTKREEASEHPVFQSGKEPVGTIVGTNQNQQCPTPHLKCLTVTTMGLPYFAFIHSQIFIEHL